MKLLLLSLLAGAALAVTPAPVATPSPFDACLAGEFAADGYTTGQNIDLDYAATAMSIDPSTGNSLISVGFLVPKVYTTGYDASAYSITFNRDHTVNALVKDATVGLWTGLSGAMGEMAAPGMKTQVLNENEVVVSYSEFSFTHMASKTKRAVVGNILAEVWVQTAEDGWLVHRDVVRVGSHLTKV